MEKIKTKDGSYTFYNENFGDIYHSRSGAKEEAMEKFARPAVEFLASEGKKEANILDICFGLGYNACAAIDLAEEVLEVCRLSITGVENDTNILGEVLNMFPDFENYHLIKKTVQNTPKLIYEKGISIRIIEDDALLVISSLNGRYDVVFHDPFSPKSCPDLWSEYFFRKIANVMVEGGRLFTYSCARSVRENLKKAGFDIRDGPKVGRRAPSTVAIRL